LKYIKKEVVSTICDCFALLAEVLIYSFCRTVKIMKSQLDYEVGLIKNKTQTYNSVNMIVFAEKSTYL